jgi:hypothetical protein
MRDASSAEPSRSFWVRSLIKSTRLTVTPARDFSARSFRENKCLSGVYAPFDFKRRRSANANNNNKTQQQQQQREAKAQI